jgi:hypothetical protein
MFKTFQQWQAENYSIKKGEKSCHRNDKGEPLFHSSQVRENLVLNQSDHKLDYSQDAEFWAKAAPQRLYNYLLDHPAKTISSKAGAILARNLQ